MAKRIHRQDNSMRGICILVGIIIFQSLLLAAFWKKKDASSRIQNQEVEVKIPEEPKPAVKKKEAPREEKKALPQIAQGKIAIVLDDWGYSLNNVKALREIKEPLTLAILPNRAYTGAIASIAQELKLEVILHLPLEPRREQKSRLEPNTIVTTMAKSKVAKIVENDIRSVPGIVGASNHQGSLATENEALMKAVLNELKKKKLYFLDSFTGKSVCKKLAKAQGVPYARRQVFLDNKNSPEYIAAQMELLAKIARQTGCAVGIGHDRPRTLEVLTRMIPELKKRGFTFVYVSELVK